jgi:hypothetical protein
MKKLFYLLMAAILAFSVSCKKDKKDDNTSIGGDQSPMGQVGTTVSSSTATIAGVSNFGAMVTALNDGVSTYSGTATVNNTALLNLLSNIPEITISSNQISTTSMRFKNTTEGIQIVSGPGPGILVNYNSSIGDSYPVGSSSQSRNVVYKSTDDDYYYGFLLIKVIKVEEPIPSYLQSTGVTKITYYANHRFGLVGVMFTFSDGTTATFPLFTSAENS